MQCQSYFIFPIRSHLAVNPYTIINLSKYAYLLLLSLCAECIMNTMRIIWLGILKIYLKYWTQITIADDLFILIQDNARCGEWLHILCPRLCAHRPLIGNDAVKMTLKAHELSGDCRGLTLVVHVHSYLARPLRVHVWTVQYVTCEVYIVHCTSDEHTFYINSNRIYYHIRTVIQFPIQIRPKAIGLHPKIHFITPYFS